MKILIVEDELHIRQGVMEVLSEEGYGVLEAVSLQTAYDQLEDKSIDAILSDIRLPDGDGFDLLRTLKAQNNPVPCILMTAFGNRDLASQALMEGAYDYVAKPLRFDELMARLERLEEKLSMRCQIQQAESDIRARGKLAILGDSSPMREVRSLIEKAATFPSPVMIEGETGVGKGLVARLLHSTSHYHNQPFVRLNCAAIPRDLMESELFGHKRGAFSGANRDREGLLATADKGTLFLDEIGELPTVMQTKLLHVLDEHRFRPVGSTKEQNFRARVIAASNHDFKKMVMEGIFRQDLYYRLDVLNIHIPPLRKRHEDIIPLSIRLLKQLCEEMAQPCPELSQEQRLWLQSQEWPGNVRELCNTLEKSLLLSAGRNFTLPFQQALPTGSTLTLDSVTKNFERSLIQQTITSCHGDKTEAARRLDIGVSTLYRKLEDQDSS